MIVLSACGGGTDTTTTAEDTEQALALSGTVDTVAGGQIDLSSIEGQDTVLWFWAPW